MMNKYPLPRRKMRRWIIEQAINLVLVLAMIAALGVTGRMDYDDALLAQAQAAARAALPTERLIARAQ